MDSGNQGPDYRRGLVLGLTLAEVFLLLLFLLILLFSYLLAQSDARWQALKPIFDQAGLPYNDIPQIQESSAAIGASLEEYGAIAASIDSDSEAAKLAANLSALKSSLAEIGLSIDDTEEIKSRLVEATNAQILEERYELVCGKAEEVEKLLDRYHNDGDTAEDILRVCAPTTDISEFSVAKGAQPETLGEAKAVIRRLEGQNTVIAEQLEELAQGNGLVFPPCWARADNPRRAVYSYNVFIRDEGLLLRAGDDRTGQDLTALTQNGLEPPLGEIISPQRFFDETTGMFDWSVEQRCRFFVRVWDETSATNKVGYQQALRQIEGHFYKYLVISQ